VIKSINIFHNGTFEPFAIRIEYWDTDKLVDEDNTDEITPALAAKMTEFMKKEKS
jgi:hypothetical protein